MLRNTGKRLVTTEVARVENIMIFFERWRFSATEISGSMVYPCMKSPFKSGFMPSTCRAATCAGRLSASAFSESEATCSLPWSARLCQGPNSSSSLAASSAAAASRAAASAAAAAAAAVAAACFAASIARVFLVRFTGLCTCTITTSLAGHLFFAPLHSSTRAGQSGSYFSMEMVIRSPSFTSLRLPRSQLLMTFWREKPRSHSTVLRGSTATAIQRRTRLG
ncbi:unnamed protein product [Closterium sp. NIES-54]